MTALFTISRSVPWRRFYCSELSHDLQVAPDARFAQALPATLLDIVNKAVRYILNQNGSYSLQPNNLQPSP